MLRLVLSFLAFAVPCAAWAGFSIGADGSGSAEKAQADKSAEVSVSANAPTANATSEQAAPGVVVGNATLDDSVVVRASTAPAESWIVSPSDATLRHVLAKWTARAGWQLVWEAPVDVPVTVSASFDGDFRSAVKALFSSLSAAEVNLTGLMYTGNRVLRVTESGRRAQ